jgi:hypothetical protein
MDRPSARLRQYVHHASPRDNEYSLQCRAAVAARSCAANESARGDLILARQCHIMTAPAIIDMRAIFAVDRTLDTLFGRSFAAHSPTGA